MDDAVTLSVCEKNRALICKNHSATTFSRSFADLGGHVEQAGFYDAGRLVSTFRHISQP